MRNKLMITISDVRGSKQYTVHELIRRLAIWVVLAVVLLFIGGAVFIKILSSQVDTLDKKRRNIKRFSSFY